ncbi:hypothetical protein GCM10008904_01590 [Paraclostridium ghonii]
MDYLKIKIIDKDVERIYTNLVPVKILNTKLVVSFTYKKYFVKL